MYRYRHLNVLVGCYMCIPVAGSGCLCLGLGTVSRFSHGDELTVSHHFKSGIENGT